MSGHKTIHKPVSNTSKITRRDFLYGCIGGSLMVLPILAEGEQADEKRLSPSQWNLDDGWRLWPETNAQWKNDTLYLPEEVNLAQMPANPPAGGWKTLTDTVGIPVTLPATVEEYYWGKMGLRPYHDEYEYEQSDTGPQNGNYLGVSWWWRNITAPSLADGQRLIITFRGARFRAEVYCNGILCGYTIMTELPFSADITHAAKPGQQNILAVRITNPGGRLDWIDFTTFRWGEYDIPMSHGFGGLDGGISMQIRDSVEVSDLAVLNRPEFGTVRMLAEVSCFGSAYAGALQLAVSRYGKDVWKQNVQVVVNAGETRTVIVEAQVKNADLWDLDHPNLYTAHASIPGHPNSAFTRTFGFRWFTADGIGKNARLILNGKRIVLRSAISWGFWGVTGIWPSPELAEREVNNARALGLNCLQFHRNVAKPLVLDAQDRIGLLRYEEPGAGCNAYSHNPKRGEPVRPLDTSGKGSEDKSFTGRYERAKILQMVRRDRSHPSLVMYCVQNEDEEPLGNPCLFYNIRHMQELDPSRIIVQHSGIGVTNEIAALPYQQELLCDDGTGYSGWADQHTVGGPGVYQDAMYQNPMNFSHASTNQREIVVWGEMLGCATPGDYEAITDWYKKGNCPGYDRLDSEKISDAYTQFIHKYGFEKEFPNASSLFRAIGAKCYFFWQKLMENCRISDAVDYMVISGWESTTIDDHSGIVDLHRNFKGDSQILRHSADPDMLVIKPHHFVLATGEDAIFDMFLVNENGRKGSYNLSVIGRCPRGRIIFQKNETVEVTGGDVYGQLLKEGYRFPVEMEGKITIEATLASQDGFPISRTEELLSLELKALPYARNIAVAENEGGQVLQALSRNMGLAAVPLDKLKQPDIILAPVSAGTAWQRYSVKDNIAGAIDQRLFQNHLFGKKGIAARVEGMSKGTCTVDLYFAEVWADAPDKRVFDVAINGNVVLAHFDIFKETGGKFKAIIKKFTTDAPDGVVEISFPQSEVDNACISAFLITDSAGKKYAYSANAEVFKDADGQLWQPIQPVEKRLPIEALEQVRAGSRLVVIGDSGEDIGKAASILHEKNVLQYKGLIGAPIVTWMGSWYFNRSHWLFDGLPTGGVMNWQYQVTSEGSDANGLLLDAEGMEVLAGYGRDHQANVGIGVCSIPYGKGEIILYCLPGMVRGLFGDASGIHPAAARKLIANALRKKI
jgi:hypothetical protein